MQRNEPFPADTDVLYSIVKQITTLKPETHDFQTTVREAPKKIAAVAFILRMNPLDDAEHIFSPPENCSTMQVAENFIQENWVQNSVLELFFIKRQINARDRWSGHVAFPGGKKEPDETIDDTLVREVFEETGIKLGNTRHYLKVGVSDSVIVTGGVQVTPFVYLQLVSPASKSLDPIKLSESEVQAYRWIPVRFFMEKDKSKYIHADVSFPLVASIGLHMNYDNVLLPKDTLEWRQSNKHNKKAVLNLKYTFNTSPDDFIFWGLSLFLTMQLFKVSKLPLLFPDTRSLINGKTTYPLLNYLLSHQQLRGKLIRFMLAMVNKKRVKALRPEAKNDGDHKSTHIQSKL